MFNYRLLVQGLTFRFILKRQINRLPLLFIFELQPTNKTNYLIFTSIQFNQSHMLNSRRQQHNNIITRMQQIQLIIPEITMDAKTLFVTNHLYPFGHATNPTTKVQQLLSFKTQSDLQQKKVQIIKKSQLVTNPSLIRLTAVNQQAMSLLLSYQFIPHSLQSYLRSRKEEQPPQIWSMTKKLFMKKMAFQLTLLTSYLGKMKIETQLNTQHLGISHDEKIKLYIPLKSKMGIKQEIQLIIVYNQNKEKILKQIQQLFDNIDNPTPKHLKDPNLQQTDKQNNSGKEPEGKTNSPLKAPLNKNINNKSNLFRNQPTIDNNNSFLRHTRTFQESSDFRKRKMSSGHFDFGSSNDFLKPADRLQEPSKSPKNHKYSFQLNTEQPESYPTSESSYSNHTSFPSSQFQQNNDNSDPSVARAKSIKIELQQKQNLDSKRQRKDSYKVKITTVRQYELQGNPSNLFGGAAKEDDIFQYFSKRAKRQEQEEQKKNQDPQKQEEDYVYSQGKNRKQTVDTHATIQEPMSPTSPSSPWSLRQRKNTDKQNCSRLQLEQRIREAKERTQKAIILMKTFKK